MLVFVCMLEYRTSLDSFSKNKLLYLLYHFLFLSLYFYSTLILSFLTFSIYLTHIFFFFFFFFFFFKDSLSNLASHRFSLSYLSFYKYSSTVYHSVYYFTLATIFMIFRKAQSVSCFYFSFSLFLFFWFFVWLLVFLPSFACLR